MIAIDEKTRDNIMKLTGETFHFESKDEGYCPEEMQLFFVTQDKYRKSLIGLIDVLRCMRVAEEQGDLPPLGKEWWKSVSRRYELGIVQGKAGEVSPIRNK